MTWLLITFAGPFRFMVTGDIPAYFAGCRICFELDNTTTPPCLPVSWWRKAPKAICALFLYQRKACPTVGTMFNEFALIIRKLFGQYPQNCGDEPCKLLIDNH